MREKFLRALVLMAMVILTCAMFTGCRKKEETADNKVADAVAETQEAGGNQESAADPAKEVAKATPKPNASKEETKTSEASGTATDTKNPTGEDKTGNGEAADGKDNETVSTKTTATPKPTTTATPKPAATATPKPMEASKTEESGNDNNEGNTSESDKGTTAATATPKPTATATTKPTATPKPAATVTPKPTATPTPTPTPEPTATPTPEPVKTPEPTPEPTPTPTPTPVHTCNYQPVTYIEASCGGGGWVNLVCECGANGGGYSVDPLGHSEESYVISDGDCVSPATIGHKCSVCGVDLGTSFGSTNPNDHDYGVVSGEVFNEETFKWETVTVTQCLDCGATP